MSSIMWVEEYRPKKTVDIVGNEKAKGQFLDWLEKWKIGNKAALLYGPPGVGKTTLVKVTARELGLDLIEMNASDFRTEEKVMRIAGRAATESSLGILSGAKGTLIFLDEVDGVFGREDKGGIAAVLKVIRTSQVPVVLVANNPWDPRLRYMRGPCEMIRFYGIRLPTIVSFLKKIARSEGIIANDEALRIIAEKAEGDLRSAVNDFQALAEKRKILELSDVAYLAKRDRRYNVFDTLEALFSAKNIWLAEKVLNNSEIDLETLLQTIHDNLPIQFQAPEKLAGVYDSLSKADVVLGRIKRNQDWRLMKYVLEQLSTGIVLASGEYHYVRYRFPPTKMAMMGRAKGERNIRDEINARLGDRCHISSRVANLDFIPFLRVIFETDIKMASEITKWFNFDEEMVTYLTGSEKQAKTITSS